jgi:hypothetical protein
MTENDEPARTLPEAAAKHGGAELSDDAGVQFPNALLASKAAAEFKVDLLGCLAASMLDRLTVLRPSKKDGRLVAEIVREVGDGDDLPGWVAHKTKKLWLRVFDVQADQRPILQQLAPVDDRLRHLVAPDGHGTWYIKSDDGVWGPCRESFKVLALLAACDVKD